jgi:hypothetical protein
VAAAAQAAVPRLPELDPETRDAAEAQIFEELATEDIGTDAAGIYQDYLVRCRMRGISDPLPLREFRRRYALLKAGITDVPGWEEAIGLAAALPEEMLAPFLAIARAARDELECPSDADLALLYGTQSAGRAKRMLAFIEETGLIVSRTDLAGKRSIAVPHLGWSTAPAAPDPSRPSRLARIDTREQKRASVR